MRHTWTSDDDGRLLAAMDACAPLIEAFEDADEPRSAWWNAVAGRMLPQVVVTGAACRSRHGRLKRAVDEAAATAYSPPGGEDSKEVAPNDAWARASALADRVEREMLDSIADDLRIVGSILGITKELHARTSWIQYLLEELARVWDISVPDLLALHHRQEPIKVTV